MTNYSNSILINESLSMISSYGQSKIDISTLDKEDKISEYSNYNTYLKNISDSFNQIKDLKQNFSIDSYERLTSQIRNNIRKIRKDYYESENAENQKSKKIKNKDKDINKKQIQNSSNNLQPSSTAQSNLKTKSNTGNNTNSNSNSKQENNDKANNIFSGLNDTTLISGNDTNNIINYYTIKEIYNITLEISSYLLCYDDIYINYQNKSAYFTLKLFFQFSSLIFIEKIGKLDFLIMMINKICNILCKYNYLQKNDETIKKILDITEKDINKIKNMYKLNSDFIKNIHKVLKKEIKKFDLPYKLEKIDDENILNNLSIDNTEYKKKLDFNENDIIYKFNRLKQENEILEKIQNNLDENHKMFLKEPIKAELEVFNLLMNNLSKYKTPLIKKKFLDIILRNKEVFNYINEDIFFEKIPQSIIKNYNLYPFNKNLSVFIDKYIEAGKIILDQLSIPLEQDYLHISTDLEKFAKKFLDKLFEKLKVNYEVNYYHLTLFAYMIVSKLPNKDNYFNRLSVLCDSNSNFTKIYEKLQDTEDILNLFISQENANWNIILFDFKNINNNMISFLLEKKTEEKEVNDKKKNKNKKITLTNLELCSILSKKIFDMDSLYIILTISLKYWAIQRGIFKYDYIQRKYENPFLDDTILLYLIFYFLIHKGKIDCFDYEYENKNGNKKKENKDENKSIDNNNKIINEKEELKDTKYEIKEQNNKKIEKKSKENKKEKISITLKTLGELFIEFFWFIHELVKLSLTENETKEEQILHISLSSKKYILKNSEIKDKENDIVLKLIFSDIIIYELDKRGANILKTETTRALYYLLSKNAEGIFAFDKHIPFKKFN